MSQFITTEAELDALYGTPAAPALLKEIDYISDHYRRFVELCPFVVIATVGPEGLDCSPRGDPAGFVRIVDPHTVLLPDRQGNNRVDALRNLVRDPRVSLLFLIPGVERTLRINGRARISVDPDLCGSFSMNAKLPRSVLVVAVERVYFQCPKALVRSRLWDPGRHVDDAVLPSTGTMIKVLQQGFDGEAYDRAYPERLAETIY